MKVLIHERRYRDRVQNVLQNTPLIGHRIIIEDGAGNTDEAESSVPIRRT